LHADEVKKRECRSRRLRSFTGIQKYFVLVFRTVIDQSRAQQSVALFERMFGSLQQERGSFRRVIVVIKPNHNRPITPFLPQCLCRCHDGRQGAYIPAHLALLGAGVHRLTDLERPRGEYEGPYIVCAAWEDGVSV
jgi:hypothetical protein